MIIEKNDDAILIKLPLELSDESQKSIINFIEYQMLISKSKAKQKEIDDLANMINKNWVRENLEQYLQ